MVNAAVSPSVLTCRNGIVLREKSLGDGPASTDMNLIASIPTL
jgi:hypothetical protein